MAAVSWHALAAQLAPVTLLNEQLFKLAWRTLPLAISSLSSCESSLSGSSWLMGRRDKRTCKGKVFKGSSGNARPKRPQQPSLQWQREQQRAAAAQKPIPIPYPHKKSSPEALMADPVAEPQLRASHRSHDYQLGDMAFE